MEEIQNLRKQIDFNNLTYHHKGKNFTKNFIGFKNPLSRYRDMKVDYITLEKAEEFKSNIKKIILGSKKSENRKSAIKNIKTLYELRKTFIELFDYSRIVSKAKHRRKYGKVSKY